MQNEIKLWCPKTWPEFIGKQNHRPVERLQHNAIAHRRPQKLLLIGPYGCAKTTLGRFTIRANRCSHVTVDGDPCHVCSECTRQGPLYNGDGAEYQQYEFDCHRIVTRAELLPLLEAIELAYKPAVLFDQFEALETAALNALLTFLHDFRGVFIATITDVDFRELPPPLFERLRKIYLSLPETEEMVAFFKLMAPQWGVIADDEMLRLMVTRTEQSFRTCLDILQAAQENDPPVLNRDTIQEFL